MKFLTILAAFAAATVAQAADSEEVVRVLKDSTTFVGLELNNQSVFCTSRGYGTVQLKVSVPDLDWLAHFDHRVVGERLPCITGGVCGDDLQPNLLVKAEEPVVSAPIRVILREALVADYDQQHCKRQLREEVQSLIRGIRFTHHKAGKWEDVEWLKCQQDLAL